MGTEKKIDYCFYWNEWGCLRSKECMCGKDKKKFSKVVASDSIQVGEQALENSLRKKDS